ncbi:MAG: M3 family oligoendopeptidase [Nitrospirae bacterium]|nr:M3 family oligoendopeptidase [Nitrospirota bacterium]
MSFFKEDIKTRWSISDLLSSHDDAGIEPIVSALDATVKEIEALRPMLLPDIKEDVFASMLSKIEMVARLSLKLGGYSQLWFSEDTQDQNALAFMGRMEQIIAEAYNKILFFNLWWKALEDEAAERLMLNSGDLRYYLEQQRLFKKHALSEPEEKIINLKDINGSSALLTIYDMITSKFTFNIEIDGEIKCLTRDSLMAYIRSPLAAVREAAYKEQFRVYGQEESVLGQIYIYRVRDWASENIRVRNFSSPVNVRNLLNDIPDKVVDTLLDVCSGQAGVFQRYFKLKAKWLGFKDNPLQRYDIYTPLKKESDKNIPYKEAVEMVLDSLNHFSPIFSEHAIKIFESGHIDSEIRQGKRGGAFCFSVLPELTPWVLLNYTGELRQVVTLAHELGHAIHSLLAAEHSLLTFQPALPLAETASVFSEMLLTDRILAYENDHAIRRDILASAVDDIYATVMRQAFFVIFEREAHKLVADGKPLEELHNLYMKTLLQQFGDSVEVSEDFSREWLCIPHIFHTPFYCYAYSFGQLLSLSLYRQYKEEGESFKPRLIKILSHGGAASPSAILTEAGIDMFDEAFWMGGFKVIEGMIDELEQL